MKKRMLSLLLLLALTLSLFTACGSNSSSKETATADYAPQMPMEEPAAAFSADYDYAMTGSGGYGETEAYSEEAQSQAANDEASEAQKSDMAEKIIYSASAEIETLDYDAAVDMVYTLLTRYGGFIADSSVSGTDYYNTARGRVVNRSASFTIRVPVANFAGMKSALGEIGYVTWLRTWSENITTQFYDTQARMEAYETERDTLNEMMARCETVSDMIEVEARLSEVQYEIDSLRSVLQNWQNQVDYSTITLSISEVQEYEPVVPEKQTYWQRLKTSFVDTLDWLGEFFQDFSIVLVCAIPCLVVPVIVIVLIVKLTRKRRAAKGIQPRTRAERKAAKKAKKAAKKAAKKGLPPQDPEE